METLKSGSSGCLVTAKESTSVSEAEQKWIRESTENGADVIVFHSLDQFASAKENGFDVVNVSAVVAAEAVKSENLEKALKVLKADGQLIIRGQTDKAQQDAGKTALLLGGFVDTVVTDSGDIVTKRPKWEESKEIPGAKAGANGENDGDKNQVWKLMANDFGDHELEADDDLDDDDFQKISNPADCGPAAEGQKKRACKNCSCGLKEMEEAATEEEMKNIKPDASACGNCAKGDAFRCASCPYLGTPTFEVGTKPEIKVQKDGTKILLDVGDDDI